MDEESKFTQARDTEMDTEGATALPKCNREEEEAMALEENCEYFARFLGQLKRRGTGGMNKSSISCIKTMMVNMNSFLDQEDGQNDKHNSKKTDNKDKKNNTEKCTDKAKGAISKTIVNAKKETNMKIESEVSDSSGNSTYDESESNNSSVSSEDSNTSNEKELKKKKSRTKRKQDNLTRVLRKLDSRQMPKQDKFDENSGQDFEKYLIKFERYCKNNFRGDRDFWIGEMEDHLSGKMLDGFKSLRTFKDTYESIKGKMITWFKDDADIRKSMSRKKFQKAKPKSGESLFLYSTRLESLFRLSFPKHTVATSNTLINQFQNSISRSTRDMLKSQIVAHKLKNEREMKMKIHT